MKKEVLIRPHERRIPPRLRAGVTALSIVAAGLTACGDAKPPADFDPDLTPAIGSVEHQLSKFAADVDEKACSNHNQTVETGGFRDDGTVCKGSLALLARDGRQITINVLKAIPSRDEYVSPLKIDFDLPESRYLVEIVSPEGSIYRPAADFFGNDRIYVDIEGSLIQIDLTVAYAVPAIETIHEGTAGSYQAQSGENSNPLTPDTMTSKEPHRLANFDPETQCISLEGYVVKSEAPFKDSIGRIFFARKAVVREDDMIACQIIDNLGEKFYVIADLSNAQITIVERGIGLLDSKGYPTQKK